MSLLLTRRFSTAAVKSHAPPKKTPGVIGRYAGALFTSASKANVLDKVEVELSAFSGILKKNPNFSVFLKNPTVQRADKVNQISQLVGEDAFSQVTRNLLLTMAANGKIHEVGKLLIAFEDIMQAHRGISNVVVTSASPLGKKEADAIQKAVTSMVGSGKKIELKMVVNDKILGGLQVQIDDRFLDLSVASRVSALSASI